MPSEFLQRGTSGLAFSSNQDVAQRGFPDGSVPSMDFLMSMMLAGRVFTAQTGSAASPSTFKTGYTTAQPELVVDCVAGTMIIPVSIQVELQTSAGTLNHVVAVTGTNNVGAGTSTAVTPTNNRNDALVTTNCSSYSLYSGNGTAPTGVREFWRAGNAFADANTMPGRVWTWDWRQGPVSIVGLGTFAIYVPATGSAATGYIKAMWIELPSAAWTG